MKSRSAAAFLILAGFTCGALAHGDDHRVPMGSTATGPGGLRTGGGTSMVRAQPAPQAEVSAFESADCIVYFDLNSAAVREDQKSTIGRCSEYFIKNREARVTLDGYADERGSKEENVQLGKERAEAVLNMLTSRGVAPKQVALQSFGEDRPADPGHTETAWSHNRRVQFSTQGANR